MTFWIKHCVEVTSRLSVTAAIRDVENAMMYERCVNISLLYICALYIVLSSTYISKGQLLVTASSEWRHIFPRDLKSFPKEMQCLRVQKLLSAIEQKWHMPRYICKRTWRSLVYAQFLTAPVLCHTALNLKLHKAQPVRSRASLS
jgi:hypothetical protein